MIEKLEALIGKNIESEEIKSLFAEWNVAYPKKTTVTPNNSSLSDCKMKRNGLELHFHLGGNSKFAKPIPAVRKGGFVALLRELIFTPKYQGELPFGLTVNMNPQEITKILGEPKVTNFMHLDSIIWRKPYKDKFEVIASDVELEKGKFIREMRISVMWDNDLDTLEDYEKAGL
jgi:hypothetical protein